MAYRNKNYSVFLKKILNLHNLTKSKVSGFRSIAESRNSNFHQHHHLPVNKKKYIKDIKVQS